MSNLEEIFIIWESILTFSPLSQQLLHIPSSRVLYRHWRYIHIHRGLAQKKFGSLSSLTGWLGGNSSVFAEEKVGILSSKKIWTDALLKGMYGLAFVWRVDGLSFQNGLVTSWGKRDWWIVIKKGLMFVIAKGTYIFIMPRSLYDNTLYFDITLMLNGMIILWPGLI